MWKKTKTETMSDLPAPNGYYWNTGVYNDEDWGWTGFAELYAVGQKTTRRWWESRTVGRPRFVAHRATPQKSPDELIRSAKQSCLDDYNKEVSDARRDEIFRKYVTRG